MNTRAYYFFGVLFLLAGIGIGLILFGPQQEPDLGKNSVFNNSPGTSITQTTPAVPTQSTQYSVPNGVSALVKRTVDGDTLSVIVGEVEEKVRLLGINTPESVDPRRAVECYGKEASRQMDILVTGHHVILVPDFTNDDRDKYGRLLRYVYLEDGTFVNEWMVKQGYAFAYTTYPFRFKSSFVQLERIARSNELGLWNSTVCPYYTSK